jgi:hypothetical protein
LPADLADDPAAPYGRKPSSESQRASESHQVSETRQESAEAEGCLVDGSAPATARDLLSHLDELGIAARSFEHPAVYTVEEAKALRGELAGVHIKNLMKPPTFHTDCI